MDRSRIGGEYDITRKARRSVIGRLRRMRDSVMEAKAIDYATAEDAYANFRFVEYIVRFAMHRQVRPMTLVFLVFIGTKLARLIELDGREAVNESKADSHVDLTNYCELWHAYETINEERKGKGGRNSR